MNTAKPGLKDSFSGTQKKQSFLFPHAALQRLQLNLTRCGHENCCFLIAAGRFCWTCSVTAGLANFQFSSTVVISFGMLVC